MRYNYIPMPDRLHILSEDYKVSILIFDKSAFGRTPPKAKLQWIYSANFLNYRRNVGWTP
jgi:hypothetical protein